MPAQASSGSLGSPGKVGVERLARGLVAAIALLSPPALAASDSADQIKAQDDRIAELERTVAVLADELERARREAAIPEEQTLSSKFGLGPAAAKIYDLSRGLSIGGYGEGYYTSVVGDQGDD